MQLAAIYNIWDGEELLAGSIACIQPYVDIIIIVYQRTSNFGEAYDPLPAIQLATKTCRAEGPEIILVEYIPQAWNGAPNEINKRNLGLEFAREHFCTHFLHMDCDEYYQDFGAAKQQYIQSGAAGSVCPLYTYFKHPTWRCAEPDGYYVPFIHRLMHNSTAGVSQYPFYVDPTRRINEKDVILLTHHMHHFSWVRTDINRKARNSTARNNIAAGTLIADYNNPHLEQSPSGYYIKDMDRKILLVDNLFGISLS